ncbi:hypothetical protein XF36_23200 [Pseudonocardia sp. HH130629-09]|nr:hypothetical protein XF36_23200 [Pseudonocardia sp. HH130629-09]
MDLALVVRERLQGCGRLHAPAVARSGQMAKYEYELHAFDGLGLSDLDRDAALSHLLAFVRQHALAEQEAREAALASSLTDEQ